MPKKTSWHEMVKKVLKEIGERRGYDVSESEKVKAEKTLFDWGDP